MSERSDFFSRVGPRVNLPELERAFIVVVGVGAVGSAIASELARSGVGHLAVVDGDELELHNVARHALPPAYVGVNKAEALAAHLRLSVPGIDTAALPRHVDDALTDDALDRLLSDADLIVVATDRRAVQRRVARRALALDRVALVPGMYPDRGGEVFVQLGPTRACFLCWDAFRPADSEVRGAHSINADMLAVVQQSTYLALALLDGRSEHARELAPPPGDSRPRQLFVSRPGAALLRVPVGRRPGCPSCAVGPSPLNDIDFQSAAGERFASPGQDAERAGAWAMSLAATTGPPEFEAVTVSEELVVEGATVTIAWHAQNATAVELETVGRRGAVGQADVVVTATRAFRLTAINPFGRSERLSAVVRVVPLPGLPALDFPPAPVPPFQALTRAPLGGPSEPVRPAPRPVSDGITFPGWPPELFPAKP